MNKTLETLETYWKRYVGWCLGNGLNPDFSDFMIWLDDQDIDVGQHDE